MPIRFTCPACRQPLEIDDDWGGQSVACPYCRKVVTAPRTSTWLSGEIPVASPGRPESASPPPPGFAPPPPPPGYEAPPYRPSERVGSAGWALTLSVLGALVAVGVSLVWLGMFGGKVMQRTGPEATQEEVNRIVQELVAKGETPRHPALAGAATAAALASIAGLVLGVRSLVRQEPRRGLAIAACILGAMFLICQMMLMLMIVGAPAQAQPQPDSAAPADEPASEGRQDDSDAGDKPLEEVLFYQLTRPTTTVGAVLIFEPEKSQRAHVDFT